MEEEDKFHNLKIYIGRFKKKKKKKKYIESEMRGYWWVVPCLKNLAGSPLTGTGNGPY